MQPLSAGNLFTVVQNEITANDMDPSPRLLFTWQIGTYAEMRLLSLTQSQPTIKNLSSSTFPMEQERTQHEFCASSSTSSLLHLRKTAGKGQSPSYIIFGRLGTLKKTSLPFLEASV